MSTSRLNRANLLRLPFMAVIGTAFLATSIPANAQEEEDNGYDIQIIRRVLSAVGLRDDKPPIDYRERSPLVVPPTTSCKIKNPPKPISRTDVSGARMCTSQVCSQPLSQRARCLIQFGKFPLGSSNVSESRTPE